MTGWLAFEITRRVSEIITFFMPTRKSLEHEMRANAEQEPYVPPDIATMRAAFGLPYEVPPQQTSPPKDPLGQWPTRTSQ